MKRCNRCCEAKSLSEFNRCRRLRDGHVGHCKACHSIYYKRNKPAALARTRRRRAKPGMREHESKQQRDRRRKFPIVRMLQEASVRARAKGLPFSLSEADIVIPVVCPALGIEIKMGVGVRSEHSPSIDRVIPALGYVSGNVRVISWRANRLKNDATLDELKRIVEYYEGAIAVTYTETAS